EPPTWLSPSRRRKSSAKAAFSSPTSVRPVISRAPPNSFPSSRSRRAPPPPRPPATSPIAGTPQGAQPRAARPGGPPATPRGVTQAGGHAAAQDGGDHHFRIVGDVVLPLHDVHGTQAVRPTLGPDMRHVSGPKTASIFSLRV